ncbi:MAG: hypothetical protein J6Q50_05005 [Clostridia bacterium]|nr:hypothetical protein [Clostridia bacterium]
MKKLWKVDVNGSVSFSVDNKLFESVRKINNWYTNSRFTTPVLVIAATIDLAGFYQVAQATLMESAINRTIIVAAFVIAFELAPLYVGYAICLKAYNLGERIRKYVFWFSLTSFILGVVGNAYYRFSTMNFIDIGNEKVQLPFTVLMVILPLSTSFMNFAIGCLSFDPLSADLKRLSKKLYVLRTNRRNLEGQLETFKDDINMKTEMIAAEESMFECAKIEVLASKIKYKDYVNNNTTEIDIK